MYLSLTITKTNKALRNFNGDFMVNLEDRTEIDRFCSFSNKKTTVFVETPNQLKDLDKYFVKDVLNILDSTDMKGKTKLKEIRRKIYEYLKAF